MTAPDDSQTTGQADRDTLAALIQPGQWITEPEEIADAILASDWLADLLATERARTLAPVLARLHSPEADKFRDEACRHVVKQPYAENRYVRLLDELRAACDPDAATRHDHDVAAQALRCTCDGGAYEVKAHPFIVNSACSIHGDRADTLREDR